MNKYIGAIFFILFFSANSAAYDKECVRINNRFGYVNIYGSLYAAVKPDTKEGDKVGEIRYYVSGVEEISCDSDAVYYGRIVSNGNNPMPERYKVIDGHQAYYLPLTNKQYAYVLFNDMADEPYRDSGPITIRSNGVFGDKNAIAYVYAAKDNPGAINESTARYGIGRDTIRKYGTQDEGAIVYYLPIDLVIEPGPIMCAIEADNENIIMELPRISLAKFNNIGFPSDNVFDTKKIEINCTGEMSATFTLNANNITQTKHGSVIIPDNEGKNGNANGVGFILSVDDSDQFVSNGEKLQLEKRQAGKSSISLRAHYYRYNNNTNELMPGKLSATAGFTLQFD